MKFYQQLSDVGSGELKLPRGDAKAPAMGQVIRVRYRGDERFAWIVESVHDDVAKQELAYTGRGLLSILDDAIVWQEASGDKIRTWSATTYAAILIDLIEEAKARGCFPDLSWDFTDTQDSEGQDWPDTTGIVLNVGTSLLQVARDFAAVGAELTIGVNFVLHAFLTTGYDHSEEVIFRLGQNCTRLDNNQELGDLRNVLMADYSGGRVVISDAPSIAANRRREALYSVTQATDGTTAQAFADNELEARKDPKEAIALEVFDANAVALRVFTDYNLGDTVSVDFGTGALTSYRIRGLQVEQPNGTEGARVIVELNTLALELELRNAIALQRNFPGAAGSATNTTTASTPDTAVAGHNADPLAHAGIQEAITDLAAASMLKAVYDTDDDDVVDHAALADDLDIGGLAEETSPAADDMLVIERAGVRKKSEVATVLAAASSGTVVDGPRGFLINGKIVVSVASNNLTVAIKNMAGNDPSSDDPVYCRIGDARRTITAALSVTANAATNWGNAGGAELATKEIDWFPYLGYNATDGVVLGFSRIPWGTQYSSFSATAANEAFCKISTITNAAAGDVYENIGRFAATLSAGAGYTWTVPTFTPTKLIQRPIFETRWLAYAAVVTSGSGSFTTLGTVTTAYQISGSVMHFQFDITITTNGTAAGGVNVTIPFSQVYSREVDFLGRESAVVGTAIIGLSQTANLILYLKLTDLSHPGGNGYRLVSNGTTRII